MIKIQLRDVVNSPNVLINQKKASTHLLRSSFSFYLIAKHIAFKR